MRTVTPRRSPPKSQPAAQLALLPVTTHGMPLVSMRTTPIFITIITATLTPFIHPSPGTPWGPYRPMWHSVASRESPHARATHVT